MRLSGLVFGAATAALLGCGEQEVSGTVRWSDGTPAVGVNLMFVAPGDDITEAITGSDGRFASVVPDETYGVLAVTRGAASDPVGIEGVSRASLELRRPSQGIAQALTTSCAGKTYGVAKIRSGGDIEIPYYGTLDYLYVPYWLMNLRWASTKRDPAERGQLYAPDPNAWHRETIAQDRSGRKTLLVLVPRRYQAFSKYFHGLELTNSIYVCAH
jgi:hypothetical protein